MYPHVLKTFPTQSAQKGAGREDVLQEEEEGAAKRALFVEFEEVTLVTKFKKKRRILSPSSSLPTVSENNVGGAHSVGQSFVDTNPFEHHPGGDHEDEGDGLFADNSQEEVAEERDWSQDSDRPEKRVRQVSPPKPILRPSSRPFSFGNVATPARKGWQG